MIVFSMILENNINLIDSDLIRKNFAGTYIVEDNNEVALIEVSTSHAVPKILKKLRDLNIKKENIKYLFITHIHLDHAGGAGTLLQNLPYTKLIVHPSGAKHIINPTKLIEGANAVYTEEVVKKDYGNIVPVLENNVIQCKDYQIFKIGNRELTTIFTPGHARHHISIFDNKTKGIFTGDSFGLSYPELNINENRFYQPTTTPTAFEYDKMIDSINKMMKLKPEILYFTHYGYSSNPKDAEIQIKKRLNDYIELIMDSDIDIEKRLGEYYIKECKNSGINYEKNFILNLFDIDIKLNAMGLKIWKNRSNTE